MRWKQQILSLAPYQPGKSKDEVKRQYGLEQITKLASNENPFGCSKTVTEVLVQEAAYFALYPDGYATNLRDNVAKQIGLPKENIIFGNGSDEIIQIIARSLLQPGFNTVMATPTFPQYKHNAVIEGAETREIPLIAGEHNLDAMYNALDENTNVVWLCSPNNPTGTYIPRNKLIPFLSKVPQHILVVLDEAYYEYVEADDYYDSVELVKQFSNLIVLRTFSKIYGLASLRVGYAFSSAEIIRALEPVREPFNTNSFAQLAASAALGDQEFVQTCKQANREGLEQFYQFCTEESLNYFPSQGNFILIDFQFNGNDVFQFLLERGYIVRSGNALGFPTSIRVTVGSKEQNDGVILAMKAFLHEKCVNKVK